MWKITSIILSFFLFFSIANSTSANEWYIEKLLDLTYWIEERKLNFRQIDNINFSSAENRIIYNNFKYADSLLKWEINRLYRNWKIDYYTMNWIINNHDLFIFHINRYFLYTSMKERSNYKELDSAIMRNYELSRSYFLRTKTLVLNSNK